MAELLSDPAVWASLASLTLMEIVLGIDNVVFISVLIGGLPERQATQARRVGLALALVFRIAFLLILTWMIGLTEPVFVALGHAFSWRDLILIAGGAFLIFKATSEIHGVIEEDEKERSAKKVQAAFLVIVSQIVVLDAVFSVDSIVTAIGMAQHVEVMIAAVIIAMGVMYVASGPISRFVEAHPTTKMLALAFLILIGVTLVADGLGFHIPKGYIYSAMAFSIMVAGFNIFASAKRKQRKSEARAAARKEEK
ncbi:MAG TPA: TerC family protein [Devosia sp.]|nr:TerC family protein [Devosia sp.]